jgi:hypothetical protein
MTCPNSFRPKKARQMKSKVKSIVKIFFDFKEIVDKKIHPDKPNNQFCILL